MLPPPQWSSPPANRAAALKQRFPPRTEWHGLFVPMVLVVLVVPGRLVVLVLVMVLVLVPVVLLSLT